MLSLSLVPGQICTMLIKDNKGFCEDMPSPSSDKAPSNLFFHLRRLVQLGDTTWSHMQPISCQYFIFNTDISCRLLFVLLSICSWHKRGDIMQLPSRLPNVSIKNYSRTRLSIDIDRSSRNTPIDLCVPESTVIWLTSNTITWKQEGKEDHHYINHQSFPRLPPPIICADDLMSFVCSETNFTVNHPIIVLPVHGNTMS